jgi:hypothetical protein
MVEILLDAEYQIKGQALEFDFKVDKNRRRTVNREGEICKGRMGSA